MRLQNSIVVLSLCAGGLSAPVMNAEGRISEKLEENVMKRDPQGFVPGFAAPVLTQSIATQSVVPVPVVAQPVLQNNGLGSTLLKKRSPQFPIGSQSVVASTGGAGLFPFGGGSGVSVLQTPYGSGVTAGVSGVVASRPLVQDGALAIVKT